MNTKVKSNISCLIGLLFTLTSLSVAAMPITGQIAIGGVYKLSNTGLEADTVLSDNFPGYNFLHFYGATVNADPLNFAVTGDFDGLETSAVTMLSPLQYDPALPSASPLWTVSGFSFYLTGLNVINNAVGALFLQGDGFISKAGYEDTAGTWNLSAQTGLSWSSATTALVSEPETMLLMGLGLFALVASRRKSRPVDSDLV